MYHEPNLDEFPFRTEKGEGTYPKEGNMKKRLCLVLLMLMAVSMVFAGGSSEDDSNVVRIGVFEPASGDNGAGGKQETLGIQYANYLTPTVTIGDAEYTVELVIADNESSNDRAATAAATLVNSDVSVGEIAAPWTSNRHIIATHGLVVPYWVDQPPMITATVADTIGDSLSPNSIIGRLVVDDSEVNLIVTDGLPAATASWRLAHPYYLNPPGREG